MLSQWTFIGISLACFISICYSLPQYQSAPSPYHCLNTSDRSPWSRQFNYPNQSLPIILEVTNRSSHIIVTLILSILLRERLGYHAVQLHRVPWSSPQDAIKRLRPLTQPPPPPPATPPTPTETTNFFNHPSVLPMSHINLEVWMPPGFNAGLWINNGDIIDCGPLGPTGQVGLFLPTAVSQSYLHSVLLLDHWRTLHDSTSRQRLLNTLLINNNNNNNIIQNWTSLTSCQRNSQHLCLPLGIDKSDFLPALQKIVSNAFPNGTFHFHQLNNEMQSIIQLLTNHQQQEQQEEEELDNFDKIINNQSISTLFYVLSMRPSPLSVSGLFTRLSLPEDSLLFNNMNNLLQQDATIQISSSIDNLNNIVIHSPLAPVAAVDDDDSASPSAAVAPSLSSSSSSSFESSFHSFFEINQFTKLLWKEIKSYSPEIFHLVNQFHISKHDLELLLKKIPIATLLKGDESLWNANIYYDTACEWIRSSKPIWTPWTKEWNKKKEIAIGGMFPMYGQWRHPLLALEAEKAVNSLNKDLFQDTPYKVVLERRDLSCKDGEVLEAYVSLTSSCAKNARPLLGIMAAVCSDSIEPMVELANIHRRLVVSPTVETAKFTQITKYPYFFRTIPSMMHYSSLLVDLFKHFKWTRIGLLRKDDYFLNLTIFKAAVQVKDFEIEEQRLTEENVNNTLHALQQDFIRIIVVEYFSYGTSLILCMAYQRNMTINNGYIWFINSWLPERWYFDENLTLPNSCTTSQLYSMVQGHFELRHYSVSAVTSRINELDTPPKSFLKNNISINSNKTNNISTTAEPADASAAAADIAVVVNVNNVDNGSTSPQRSKAELRDNYSEFTYDAIYVLGKATYDLLTRNPASISALQSPSVAQTYRDILSQVNVTHRAAHGTQLSTYMLFNGANERASNLWTLKQMQSGIMLSVIKWMLEAANQSKENNNNITSATTTTTSTNAGFPYEWKLQTEAQNILWYNPTNAIPGDGSNERKERIQPEEPCVLGSLPKMLNISCQSAMLIIFISIPFAIIIISGIGGVIYFRRKLQSVKHYDDYKYSYTVLADELLAYDVDCSLITVNRRLGEGAFGLVYGGDFKRNHWQNVAVKIANDDKSYSHKSDLLREAKVMCELQHENIVELFAICLKAPENSLYLVMEEMNCRDLRNFLLARRATCVDEPDNVDVCPQTLTTFALHAARALNYLHENNFVHRDVACRNCLVSNNNGVFTVKLGDFGLTRKMQESDSDRYYRNVRHSILPVCWMSPQALLYACCTVQSDIWSYGVLLYEIITFGESPYGDMSHRDVFDRVTRNELCILDCLPSSAHGSLIFDLIRDCSYYEEDDRLKSMEEIIQFLELHLNEGVVRPFLIHQPLCFGMNSTHRWSPVGFSEHHQQQRSRHSHGSLTASDRILQHIHRHHASTSSEVQQLSSFSGMRTSAAAPPPSSSPSGAAYFSSTGVVKTFRSLLVPLQQTVTTLRQFSHPSSSSHDHNHQHHHSHSHSHQNHHHHMHQQHHPKRSLHEGDFFLSNNCKEQQFLWSSNDYNELCLQQHQIHESTIMGKRAMSSDYLSDVVVTDREKMSKANNNDDDNDGDNDDSPVWNSIDMSTVDEIIKEESITLLDDDCPVFI